MHLFKRTFTLSFSLLAVLAAQAHEDKPYDLNGGHWDDWGNYHCHITRPECVPTASRNSYRSRLFNNGADPELYYLKEDWPHWEVVSGCKTMRTVVLESTSKVPVTYTNPRQCEIREGLWVDEYTGEEFTRAAQLEIDHIIPPMYANTTNGYQWDLGKRAAFANDPFNLIPVSRDIHRRKSDRGIGGWRPRGEFECDYAQAWKQVSDKYDLDLLARDESRMNKILNDCGITGEIIED